ncbi:glycosyltransferase family 2 protein [Caenimonas koreensis]|uniref:glycosyltransferase family 2 protein n=1 Tax=Caenimonas koreensis TaxID=367474 RepID=UPI003782FEE7
MTYAEEQLRLSIAIPTYRREEVLVATIEYLLALKPPACEILILDQTETHTTETHARLNSLAECGAIRWLRLQPPSIPAAMNVGLLEATHDIVLFLDDDVRPEPELIEAHLQAHAVHLDGLVAGRVIQPWQEGIDFGARIEQDFHFASTAPAFIHEFMGGNFSVRREVALQMGGFDENFVKVAYRFEAEFAARFVARGGLILYEPRACLHHLKEVAGGTRTFGEHMTTWRPDHAVGAYYYSLRCGQLHDFVVRPCRAIATRYHLKHPWRIPATLLAELGGMFWALRLYVRGPKRLAQAVRKGMS